MEELIDLYAPDLLYSDSELPFGKDAYDAGLKAVAHLYNTSAAHHGGENQAVYTQKDKNREIYSVGVLDIERSQEPDIAGRVADGYLPRRVVLRCPLPVQNRGMWIEMLVDIVAKNGNLLLNVPQKPDGTIDAECRYILQELAGWNQICGEESTARARSEFPAKATRRW